MGGMAFKLRNGRQGGKEYKKQKHIAHKGLRRGKALNISLRGAAVYSCTPHSPVTLIGLGFKLSQLIFRDGPSVARLASPTKDRGSLRKTNKMLFKNTS